MSMRKNLLMGMGLAFSLAGAAFAQQGGRPDGRPGDRRGAGMMEGVLFQGITLTDAQKTQLQQLRESERATMEANRGAMRAQMDSARAARERGDTAAARAIWDRGRVAMEQRRDAEFANIRNILTADQRTQFDKNVADLKARMDNRMREGGPGRRGDRPTAGPRRGMRALRGTLFRGITLTDAQKAQLKELNASGKQSVQSARQTIKQELTDARAARQRGDTAQARSLFQKAQQSQQQLIQQRIASVRTVLTADQRVQFDKNVTAIKARFDGRGRGAWNRGRQSREG
jgi:periplasmic protein CpxP/Spy